MTDIIDLPPPRRRQGVKGVPPGLPYTALGLDENWLYVLDPNGFVLRVPRTQISRTALVGLFGNNQELLYETYGRMRLDRKTGELTAIWRSVHTDHAADDLQKLCAAAGRFDPQVRLRGVGAWRAENDDLILHLGDRLWIPAPENRLPVTARLGLREDYIYPQRNLVPPPFGRPVSAEPGCELLDYFRGWRWGRAIDPLLLVGLIGASFLAGALDHRPQLDVTGEGGVGKSGIQHAVRQLLGPRMLLSSDASAAGLRQRTACDAVCIGLDENESSLDPKRIMELQQLRRASFGEDGESIRGGVDHSPTAFPLRSIFLSSGITLAPMDAAMRSRTAILVLHGPPKGPCAYAPARSEAGMATIGSQLLRRIADHWRRLSGEVLPAWRRILEAKGYDGRASATYGTLLACAFVLLSDGVPTERHYAEYGGELEMLQDEDKQDRIATHERLLGQLLGQLIEPSRRSGVRQTVMEKILLAAGYGARPSTYTRVEAMAIAEARENEDAKEAHIELKQCGICIINSSTGARLLAFSNTSPWIENALKETPFAALRGRAEGHSRTLLRAPGARRLAFARFGHGETRAVAMPLAYVLRGMVGPNPEETGRAWDNIMAGDPIADES